MVLLLETECNLDLEQEMIVRSEIASVHRAVAVAWSHCGAKEEGTTVTWL